MTEDINNNKELHNNINFSNLTLEDLILELDKLSNNSNPLSVSKKANEIKVAFYKKLISKSSKQSDVSKKNEINPLETKFKKINSKFRKIKQEFRKEKERQEQKNLKIKQKIITEINNLINQEESIKITFDKFRSLQVEWKNTGNVPIQNKNDVWYNYNHHVELFYDYLKINRELRDLDFKKNLEYKELLCEKAEKLIKEKSIKVSFNELQKIHEKWKEIGPVFKEKRENIWNRFQEASKIINKKRNDYFLELKQENNKNLILKSSICNKIISLLDDMPDSHQKWKNKNEELNKLIEQWKKTSPIHKNDLKKAWKEFRDSTNTFYSEKNNFYKNRKDTLASNLMIKIKICEEAERLKNSNEWNSTSKKFIQLQKEWKDSPFTPEYKSSPIWNRFKKACDQFFNSRKEFYIKLDKERDSNLEMKQKILSTLKKFKSSDNVKSDIEKIQKINKDWNNIGEVPKSFLSINNEYKNSLNSIYNSLKLNESEKKKLKLESKISLYKQDSSMLIKEKNRIKSEIDKINKNINQYENNISFFKNGTGTERYKSDIVKKIEISKSKLVELKDNLSILNKI